jgi:aminomethyltransferase
MIDRGVPRQHYEISNHHGDKIGEVTSGTMSPSRKIGIGMGYVKVDYSKTDTEIFIKIREKLLKAKVAKRV